MKKSAYISYSEEDVAKTENGNYVIQVGADFFSYNSQVGFPLKEAELFYYDVMSGLIELKSSKDALDREDAVKCLLLLKMYPLRFH